MKNHHIWLPYTQHQNAPPPLPITAAKGSKLTVLNTLNSKLNPQNYALTDGISSWWSVCHGYQHPHLVKAITDQVQQLSHVMLAGLVHEGAYKLANRLANLTNLPRVFFSDSGSTAVEVAMKMAAQYWRNQNPHTHKQRFVCFTNGYHGDTMGAMSVSDSGFHGTFTGYMPMQFMVDIPTGELEFADFDALLAKEKNQIAAVIIEPLIQGAGGMKFHSADVLAEIYRITKKHEILFIADEIATGFGRTGYMFACQEASVIPDILCLGKALTGGMLTMGATMASADVFEKFLSDKHEHAFMHGPTYMANPLACASANASLDLFETEPRLKQVAQIEEIMHQELIKCNSLPIVKDVRVKGALGVVQLHTINKADDHKLVLELRQKFIDHGVWLRPFGDVVYLAPPFVIEEKELLTLTRAVYNVLS